MCVYIYENQDCKALQKKKISVLQDVSILIPLLSSLTKDEVIFYFLSMDSLSTAFLLKGDKDL